MKVSRVLPDGKTTFEFEAATPKDVFVKLALIDDLFTEGACGCCKSKDIRFVSRKVDNGFYLEMRCLACGAQLDYGQNKEGGGIFVKKWDKDNKRPLPNGGWHVYSGNKRGDSYEGPSSPGKGHPGEKDIPY